MTSSPKYVGPSGLTQLIAMEGEDENMGLRMIHRTLARAIKTAYGRKEPIRLIRPAYKIHLPEADGLIVSKISVVDKVIVALHGWIGR